MALDKSLTISSFGCPLHVVLFQVAGWPAGIFSWGVYRLRGSSHVPEGAFIELVYPSGSAAMVWRHQQF